MLFEAGKVIILKIMILVNTFKKYFYTILWLCSLSVSTQNYIFIIIFDTQRVTELLAQLHVLKPFIIY